MKFRNKKAQNTAEYAILIALVIGAVVAMQTYAQRALQARIHGASLYLKNTTQASGLTGNTLQYEPYYQNTDSTTTRSANETTNLTDATKNSTAVTSSGSTERTEAPSTATGIAE